MDISGDSKELAERHALEHAESINVPTVKMGTPEWLGQIAGGVTEQAKSTAPTAGPSVVAATEIRIVDPLTGGEKGSKIERFDLIPVEMETGLARHYGVGATKYEDRNWEKGYKWGLSYAALRRHLAAWAGGESYDPETGSHHLIAVIWHATALLVFELRGLGTDDLRKK